MKLHPRVSRSAVELVKGFEAFRSRAVSIGEGRWTIGYGHTLTAREHAVVSEADAEALLRFDLSQVGQALDAWVFAPLNVNQFNALVAFGFNIGLENLRRSSALRRVNEGNYLVAAAAIEQWRKAELDGDSQVVDALVRRRAAEKALFLTPVEGFPHAPTGLLRPQFDPEPLAPDIPAPLAGLHDDEEPSRSLAAAATVSARLQELVPEPAAAPQPTLEAPAHEPEPEPEPEPERPQKPPVWSEDDWRTPRGEMAPEVALPARSPEPGPMAPQAVEDESFEPELPPVQPLTAPAEEDAFDEGAASALEAAGAEPILAPPAADEAPPPPFEVAEEIAPVHLGGVEPPAIAADPGKGLIHLAAAFAPEPPPVEESLRPSVHPLRAGEARLVAPETAAPEADNRRAAAPLALVGLALFLGALVAIWQGEPSLLSLVVGLIGVGCMAGGYFMWTAAGAAKGEAERPGE